MKNIVKYLFVILIFFAGNLYVVFHFMRQLEEFRIRNSPMSIKVLRENSPGFLSTIDIDDDGEDEVVIDSVSGFPGAKVFSVFKPMEEGYVLKNFGDILVKSDSFFLDFYFDEKKKIYVYRFLILKEGEFTLEERDNRQDIRGRIKFKELQHKPAGQGTGFIAAALVDLEQDGKKELLITLVSYFKHKPRGVVCFDSRSGDLLWEYYCGTLIRDMEVIDLNDDNEKEIILSTNAVNNGAEINGTSDAYSYVIVLDSRGKEIWKIQTGDWYTSALSTVSDLDNDGNFEIVTSLECRRPLTDVDGKIMVLDALTGRAEALYPQVGASFSRSLILNVRKNDVRIYVGDSSGRIWMFNRHLHLVKNIKVNAPMGVWGASTKPMRKLIYAMNRDELVAYDINLEKKIFTYSFEQPFSFDLLDASNHIIPLKTREGNHTLIKADKLYLLSDSGKSFSRIIGNLVNSGLLFSILMLILFNGFFIYTIYRFRRLNVIHIRQKNEEKSAQLFEIVQGIAHQIKNPISTILWAAEKIKRKIKDIKDRKIRDSYNQLSDFLIDDVKTLKQQANNILRLIQIREPNFQKKNLKRILQKLVEHYRAVVDEKIEVQFEMEEDITLSIDEDLIKEALVNLVDNAVDAMPEGGKLTFSAVLVTSPLKDNIKEVLIEIEDTGSGMDEEEVPRVFEPFFTKKEKGTGIGLTICKRIIEAHGGTIKIHSRKNFGTRIAVNIPIRNEN